MQFLNENPVVFFALGVLVLFLAGMVLLGIRAQRYNRTFDDTISAGRAMTFWLLVGSGVGAQIGSGFVLGGAEDAAHYGIGGAWYGVASGLGFVLVGIFTARYFRSRGYISMSDFLVRRYHDRRVTFLYVLAMMMSTFSMVAGQLLAGKAILEAFGVSGEWSVWITLGVTFVFATLTGLWGAFAASAMQSVVILAGILLALGVIVGQNGTEILAEGLPERFFTLQPYSSEDFIGIVFPILSISFTGQMIVQRIGSADTVETAVHGYILAGLISVALALVPAFLGMYGRVLAPSAPDNVVFTALLMERLPSLIAGIVLAALMSSVVSAFCGSFVMMNTLVIHDVLEEMLGQEISDRRARRLTVVSNLAVCAIAVLLTRTATGIIQIMSYGYAFVGSGCLAAIVGGMLWKRPGGRAAWLSIAAGIAVLVIHQIGFVTIPYQSVTAFAVSAVVYLILGVLLPAEENTGAAEEVSS